MCHFLRSLLVWYLRDENETKESEGHKSVVCYALLLFLLNFDATNEQTQFFYPSVSSYDVAHIAHPEEFHYWSKSELASCFEGSPMTEVNKKFLIFYISTSV